MQAQIQKGELLGEVRGKIVTTTIKEITPFEIIFEQNQEGEFTGSRYSARDMSTTEIRQRIDGTYDWENRYIQRTKEGETIVINGHGTGEMTGPSTFKGNGEGMFMTQSPKLSWLNMKKGRVEFTGDLATGEIHGKTYTL